MRTALAPGAVRALLAAVAVGAVWGATIALTLDEETVLLDVGRFLAVAFAAGSLTRDVRLGALAGTAMALAHFGAMELTPWRGIEESVSRNLPGPDEGFPAFMADVFRQGTHVHWAIVGGAAVLAAAGARRGRAGWALLAGALVADLVNRIEDPLNLAGAVAVAQAAAGVYVARRFVGRDVALAAALLPIALVLLSPSLLGADIIGQDHSEIIVIR